MNHDATTLLYDPNTQRVVGVKVGYRLRSGENLRAPANEIYLAVLHTDPSNQYAEFFRLLGKDKGGGLVVTSSFTEGVDEAFFAQFTQALNRTEFGKLLGGQKAEQAVEVEVEPVQAAPAETEEDTWEIGPAVAYQPQAEAQPAGLDDPLPVRQAPARPKKQKKGLGGLFSGLFRKKRQAVGKILFFGANEDVIQAQKRIRTILDRSGVGHIPFDEIITVNKLMDVIKEEASMMFVVDKRRVQEMGGGDILRILSEHGYPILDIKNLPSLQEAQILSLVQNVQEIDLKSVLYTQQRVCLFVSTTGGVGKTTLSLNLGNWLASRSANTLYMEILGGGGIDEVLGIHATRLEDVLSGQDYPKPINKGSKLYVTALGNNTSPQIGASKYWREYFEKHIHPKTANPYFHCVLVDTYNQMISTRYLLPFVTDVIVVSDMRPTTSVITKDTLDNMLRLSAPFPGKRFIVVHNQYRASSHDIENRFRRLKAELDAIAESQKEGQRVRLEHLVIPRETAVEDSILIRDEKERNKIIGKLAELLYGVKL